jgi:toxin-antitoxin system PIN domain toxin
VILPDVNVLVYAHREDAVQHAPAKAWLQAALAGAEPLGLSDLVLSGFTRIVTHPKVFVAPTPTSRALEFADHVRSSPRAVRVEPGARHWSIFRDLCLDAKAKGNLVPNAWFAALAIEAGGTWITTDREYARFPGLRWRAPF